MPTDRTPGYVQAVGTFGYNVAQVVIAGSLILNTDVPPGPASGCVYRARMTDGGLFALDSDADSIFEPMLVERPRGTHLGPASDADGMRPLARHDGLNAIATHVRLHALPPSDAGGEGLNVRSAAIGGAVVLGAVGAILVAKKLAPQAQRAWNQRVVPTFRSAWNTVTGPDNNDDFSPPQDAASLNEVVGHVEEDDRSEMSSTEARERLAAALLARAFSDEQLRLLQAAQVIDDVDEVNLVGCLKSLTPQQLSQGSKLILENGTLQDLRSVLGFGPPQTEPLRRGLDSTASDPSVTRSLVAPS